MSSKQRVVILLTIFIVAYGFTGVWGWLGQPYEQVAAPDGVYTASTSVRSPLLLPFKRTYSVMVPSQRDLNGHVVFARTSLRKGFILAWQGPTQLRIVCESCNGSELVQAQVDDVQVKVVRH